VAPLLECSVISKTLFNPNNITMFDAVCKADLQLEFQEKMKRSSRGSGAG